jgi:hypothetical protein
MLLVITFSGVWAARGQDGTVINFSNRDIIRQINAPFYDADGTTRLDGPNFRAALFYGPSFAPEQMVMLGAPQPFLSGTLAGYWMPANRTITMSFPGQPIYVQVRFWDSQGGAHTYFDQAYASNAKVGFSDVLQLTPPPPPQPPGTTIPLTGLRSASLMGVFTNLVVGETRTVADVMAVPNGLQFGTLCTLPVGRMRWFHLTFANPGEAVVHTEGSSIDTVLSVYTSCLLSSSACALVACSDDARVRFQAQPGVKYAVAVGGNNGATGASQVTFGMPMELRAESTADKKVEISWPAEATGFALEVTTNIAPPVSWEPVQETPSVSGGRNRVRVVPDNLCRMYRLRRGSSP